MVYVAVQTFLHHETRIKVILHENNKHELRF